MALGVVAGFGLSRKRALLVANGVCFPLGWADELRPGADLDGLLLHVWMRGLEVDQCFARGIFGGLHLGHVARVV